MATFEYLRLGLKIQTETLRLLVGNLDDPVPDRGASLEARLARHPGPSSAVRSASQATVKIYPTTLPTPAPGMVKVGPPPVVGIRAICWAPFNRFVSPVVWAEVERPGSIERMLADELLLSRAIRDLDFPGECVFGLFGH